LTGEDIALAAVKIDRKDPFFNEEEFELIDYHNSIEYVETIRDVSKLKN